MKKYVICLFLISCMFLMKSCSQTVSRTDGEVRKAFELRMNGKVDEAKTLLEKILVEDSLNAMANYEMARLKLYTFTGGGNVRIPDIQALANRAAEGDPKNVIYAYFRSIAYFMNAFMAMQTGQGDIKKYVSETADQFEKVLELKPDYHEARLYLVEIYGMLPAEMGGDSIKAAKQAEKLTEMNGYFAAKAKVALAPENFDIVKFWSDLLELEPENPVYLMETGKACLLSDKSSEAEKYFDKAIRIDPSNNILILDLARYHMYKVMQSQESASVELPQAIAFTGKYLGTTPEPVIPLKAYAKGMLSRFEMFLGNQAEAEKLMEEAKQLDPYFSRATGIPSLMLFDPPDQVCHHYFSFFSPF